MAALALGMLPYATPGELAICRSLGPLHDPGLVSFPGPGLPWGLKALWEARPVAFYTWSGLEQHSGVTQTIRAINVLSP